MTGSQANSEAAVYGGRRAGRDEFVFFFTNAE